MFCVQLTHTFKWKQTTCFNWKKKKSARLYSHRLSYRGPSGCFLGSSSSEAPHRDYFKVMCRGQQPVCTHLLTYSIGKKLYISLHGRNIEEEYLEMQWTGAFVAFSLLTFLFHSDDILQTHVKRTKTTTNKPCFDFLARSATASLLSHHAKSFKASVASLGPASATPSAPRRGPLQRMPTCLGQPGGQPGQDSQDSQASRAAGSPIFPSCFTAKQSNTENL